MNKPYFIKWLTVEGEIKEGDHYSFEGRINLCKGSILPELEKLYDRKMVEYQKVKLFLCSRKIEVGDKFLNPRHGLFGWKEHVCTNIEMGSGENYYPKEMLLWYKEDGIDYWLKLDKCYKIIGELPEDTIGKDGNELEEDEWRFYSPDIKAVLDKASMLKPPYLLRSQYIIQLQCSCCKEFH